MNLCEWPRVWILHESSSMNHEWFMLFHDWIFLIPWIAFPWIWKVITDKIFDQRLKIQRLRVSLSYVAFNNFSRIWGWPKENDHNWVINKNDSLGFALLWFNNYNESKYIPGKDQIREDLKVVQFPYNIYG